MVLARISQLLEQVIKCKKFFLVLLSGKGLTSFSMDNRTNFFGEKR